MGSKTCKGCGVEKGFHEFYAEARNVDGRMGKCKSCVKSGVRENRRNRKQQYAEYDRLRSNQPHRVEARQKYYEKHKVQISEYKKKWSEENHERVAAYKRAHYEENRQQVIARSKEWSEDNIAKVKAAKANNRRKRRAAMNASSGHFTAEEFDALCSVYGHACLCCGATDRRLEADHVIPLTRGGSNGIGNIQPLCGECNRRKFTAAVDYRLGGISSG